MRILVVSNYFPPHSVGGYDIACEAFVSRLARRGHDVSVLTSNHLVAKGRVSGSASRVLHRPQDTPDLPRLLWQDWSDRRTLRRHLLARPDVVVASNLLQLFPGLHEELARSDSPLVYFLQDPWIPKHLESSDALRRAWLEPGTGARALTRRALGQALAVLGVLPRPMRLESARIDHIVYCSNELVTRCQSVGLQGRLSQRVIHNGIDAAFFRRPADCGRHGEELQLLFVGRLVVEKGVHLAIEAVRQLRHLGLPIRLKVAGIPSYPWDYVDQIRATVDAERSGGWLELAEHVPNAKIRELYWSSDALVFPSTVREGLPMTVLEAMAASLPVVGSVTGGTGDVLRDNVNGLVFAPGSVSGLASRLAQVFRDRDLLHRLATGARFTIESEFNIERQAALLDAYLAEVAAGKAHS